MSKSISLLGFICFILFNSSCTHQTQKRFINAEQRSFEILKGWNGPEVVQTPVGKLYVYYKVFDSEPANVTYVNVKYICFAEGLLNDWKIFKVQWFYGVAEFPQGTSVIPLIYDPLPILKFIDPSEKDPSAEVQSTDDRIKTVSEKFNLETRCQRDQKSKD